MVQKGSWERISQIRLQKRWRLLPCFKNQLVSLAFTLLSSSKSVIKILIKAERTFNAIRVFTFPSLTTMNSDLKMVGIRKKSWRNTGNLQCFIAVILLFFFVMNDEGLIWPIILVPKAPFWIWFWHRHWHPTPTAFRLLSLQVVQVNKASTNACSTQEWPPQISPASSLQQQPTAEVQEK